MAKEGKSIKEFKFSRSIAHTFVAFYLIAFFSIWLISNVWTGFIVTIFLFAFTFTTFVGNCDVMFRRAGLEIIPIEYYVFGYPKKCFINYKDIRLAYFTIASYRFFYYKAVVLTTGKKGFLICYHTFNDSFLKILLSKLPRNCKIVGIKRYKGKVIVTGSFELVKVPLVLIFTLMIILTLLRVDWLLSTIFVSTLAIGFSIWWSRRKVKEIIAQKKR